MDLLLFQYGRDAALWMDARQEPEGSIALEDATCQNELYRFRQPGRMMRLDDDECETRAKAHPFSCDQCDGRQFSCASKLALHQRSHTGERPFRCSHQQCGKSYTSKTHRERHERSHQGLKQYICSLCDGRFGEKPMQCALNLHVNRIHNKLAPFNCKICGKRFLINGDLTKHNRIHSGEKPFSCDLCSKTFSDQSNLIQHRRIHQATEKAFSCALCHRRYSRPSTLRRHRCTAATAAATPPGASTTV